MDTNVWGKEAHLSKLSVAPHRWEYCTGCQRFMVVCANCGNNCCNGGSNEGCKDNCADAYAKQKEAGAIIKLAQQPTHNPALLKALKDCVAHFAGRPKSCGHTYECVCVVENAILAIARVE